MSRMGMTGSGITGNEFAKSTFGTRSRPASVIALERPDQHSQRILQVLRACFWLVAILLAGSQAWSNRDVIASDGISYLEMGNDVAQGAWSAAINGYWSPLYPLTIAAGLAIAQPSPQQEYAVVHAVNFVIFLFAAGCFEFLMAAISRAVEASEDHLPVWLLRLAGYLAFLWSTLYLITLTTASPDLLMSGFVYLASGLLLRIVAGSSGWPVFAALGFTLAAGYAAKAPLFPLSVVYLAAAWLLAPGRKASRPPTGNGVLGSPRDWGSLRGWGSPRGWIAAPLTFVLGAASIAVPLSLEKGRPTFGDSGRINYAWYVDGAAFRHWQGQPLGTVPAQNAPLWTAAPAATGVPLHATHQVLASPPVYAFDHPFHGRNHTYAEWYDPSYWNEGLRAPIDLRQQLRKLQTNLKFVYGLLLNPHFGQLLAAGDAYQITSPLWIACWLGLIAAGARLRLRSLPLAAPLLAPGLAALAMYLVVYCEPRHLAAFVTLLFLGAFMALVIPHGEHRGAEHRTKAANRDSERRTNVGLRHPLALPAAAAALVLSFAACALLTQPHSARNAQQRAAQDFAVAQAFADAGFPRDTKIATLLYANIDHVRWAHLAHARVVSELFVDAYRLDEDAFWKADAATQAEVLQAFRDAGAQAVVSSHPPAAGSPQLSGWQPLGTTHFYVLRLPAPETRHV